VDVPRHSGAMRRGRRARGAGALPAAAGRQAWLHRRVLREQRQVQEGAVRTRWLGRWAWGRVHVRGPVSWSRRGSGTAARAAAPPTGAARFSGGEEGRRFSERRLPPIRKLQPAPQSRCCSRTCCVGAQTRGRFRGAASAGERVRTRSASRPPDALATRCFAGPAQSLIACLPRGVMRRVWRAVSRNTAARLPPPPPPRPQEPGLRAGRAQLRGRLHQRRVRGHRGGPVGRL
jgi:hypothetical protein